MQWFRGRQSNLHCSCMSRYKWEVRDDSRKRLTCTRGSQCEGRSGIGSTWSEPRHLLSWPEIVSGNRRASPQTPLPLGAQPWGDKAPSSLVLAASQLGLLTSGFDLGLSGPNPVAWACTASFHRHLCERAFQKVTVGRAAQNWCPATGSLGAPCNEGIIFPSRSPAKMWGVQLGAKEL